MLAQLLDKTRLARWLSYGFALVSLWLILNFHLLSALLAGLAVHQLTTQGASMVSRRFKFASDGTTRGVLVIVISILVVALLTFIGLGLTSFFKTEATSIDVLLGKANEALLSLRTHLPDSMAHALPTSVDSLKQVASDNLHKHAQALQETGKAALTNLAHLFVGMILGAMMALSDVQDSSDTKPLAAALRNRAANLATIFRQIVSAQMKISLLNTVLTMIFLMVVLPLIGAHLPFVETLVILTFVLGLLPVVGNLMSNTLVVLVSFSVAPWVAVVSLAYLILIHKLEYFLNAKIVGHEIHAKAWELLLAMLVMETLFGLPGVIAAPIFYAYVKKELSIQGWV